MNRNAVILAVAAAMGLAASGAVVARAALDVPQDAQPAPQDASQSVTADLNRQSARQAEAANAARTESAPTAAPAPRDPVAITPPVLEVQPDPLEEAPEAADTPPAAAVQPTEPATPTRRQRARVAIIEAVDKVTASRMRFEVPVGGRPVRFDKALIFVARACEISAPDEPVEDAVAYLEVSVQPRGVLNAAADPRQIFKGWMFASSPAISGLQHPTYDAWVVGCRA